MLSKSRYTLVVLAFLLHNGLLFGQGSTDCPSPTFFKGFGDEIQSEYATTIIKSNDNNLFLAGRKGSRTFIEKMDFSGNVLWMRDFQIGPFDAVTPSEIIQDSEGMIVGCGTQGQAGLSKGFVFRYNPVANVLLWSHQITSNNPSVAGILEKGAGGNFILYQNSLLGSGEKDIEIMEIDRLTGVFNPNLAKRYEHISSDVLSKLVYFNGMLFGTGTCAAQHGFFSTVPTRQLTARFDPGTLDPIWGHINHLDTSAAVSFLGRDMLVDTNSIVTAYLSASFAGSGSDTIFLQKADIDGNMQWVRSYNISAGVLKLLAVADGYVIYGQQQGNRHIVFKTDNNGVPVWGRVLTEGVPSSVFANNFAPNQAVAVADSLYFTGIAATGNFDVFLWKMLGNGTMVENCGNVDTLAVLSTLVQNPFRTLVDLSQVFSTAVSAPAAPAIADASLDLHQYCPDCTIPDPCPEDNDFIVKINDIYCEQGKVNMQFTFCDLDGGAVPPLTITFYDGNPYLTAATVLGTYDYNPVTSDSCFGAELTDLVTKFGPNNVVDGAKIYAAVNIPANALTPFNLNDFPLTDYPECDYLNNVDLYTIHFPAVPTLNLGPDQTVCPSMGAVLDGGAGFFKYQWSNGQTSPSITVNFTGQFRLTVTDFCGFKQVDTVNVQVLTTPQLNISGEFCPGKSVTLHGFTFNQPGVYQKNLPGVNGGCDTVATFFITQLPFQTRNEIVRFCPGETVTINGVTYEDSGLAKDTLAGTIGCDTIIFYFLQQLPLPFRLDTAFICPGDSVKVGDYFYSQPGLVFDTLPSNSSAGCDTLLRVYIIQLPQITLNETVQFCPGTSVEIHGQAYSQPGDLSFLLPTSGGGCDTLLQYHLEWLPAPTRSETVSFCQGSSVNIGGTEYTAPGIVQLTVPGSSGECDTLVTYTLEWLPGPTRSETVEFCPGKSVEIAGNLYTQPGTVTQMVAGAPGTCDTLVTYTLVLLPAPTRVNNIKFCPGGAVTVGGTLYTQPAVIQQTIPGVAGECDTLVTTTLEWLPYPTSSQTIAFCPGQSVTIGGSIYTQPGIVVDTPTIAGGIGCREIVTYTLTFAPLPTQAETIEFCNGTTVTLGGQQYSQPGVVVATVPGAGGNCDTIVTYTLQYINPEPSTLTVTCPYNVSVITVPGTGPVPVNYNLPTATSDCTCPGIAWTLTAGMPSGSLFSPGMTNVCYTGTDSCGSTASCCFNVIVREEGACDTKVNGCLKYDILSITADAQQRYTYKIRVTNSCANKLIYTAIELPNTVEAVAPLNNTQYVSPEGRKYLVRNPNYTPFYSIRFKSTNDSIANGQSAVFEYTLPPQSHPTFIHVTSRLATQAYYEAHLNTFNCPIGVTPSNNRDNALEYQLMEVSEKSLLLYPNPTSGELFADLSDWYGESLEMRVLDSRGQLLQHHTVEAGAEAYAVALPANLPNGLYFMEVRTEGGERVVERFVVER